MSAGIDAPPPPPSMSRHQFNSTQWNADIGLFAKSANDFDDKENTFGKSANDFDDKENAFADDQSNNFWG